MRSISQMLMRAIPVVLAVVVPPFAGAAARVTRCEGAIQHPLTVRIRPLDPIERGRTVTFEVEVSGTTALSRGEVQMVSAGGARLAGPRRWTFGAVAAAEPARTFFAVQVPEEGHRFLLEFRVNGETEGGLATRGATYNLLPDGPADPGRRLTTPAGVRIAEYRARRIVR
jgi:hypothetical protein